METSQPTLDKLLLPYQRKFAFAPQKKKIALFGRQTGKSFDIAFIAVSKVLTSQRANPLALVISTGARAASEFLKKCVQFAEAVHTLCPDITYAATADSVKFSTGARIMSLPSGNPAGLRGYSSSLVLIDEAAFIENPEEVWAAIAPTLTRDPDSELILATTPAGKASWFYDIYLKACEDPDWYVQTTTVEDAVRDGLKIDIEELKKTISDPDVWNREYLCQFDQEYSSMVDVTLLEFADAVPQKFRYRFCGVDIGAKNDRTAIVDIMQLDDGSFFVDDIAVMHKAEYQQQLDVIRQLYQKHKWSSGYIDSVGIGNPIAEFASKQITARLKGFAWTAQNKSKAYEHLRSLVFDHKLVFSLHLKQLIVSDFQNVHRVVNEAGNVRYEAGRDSNGHSDVTSALVLALMAAKDLPGNAQSPVAMPFSSAFGGFVSRI